MATVSRTPAQPTMIIATIALITCVVGCDELGLRLGPGTMPDPIPLDQTAAAVGGAADPLATPPATADASSSTTVSSPSDGAVVAKSSASETTAATRRPLKPYREWTVTETAIDSLGRLGEKAVRPLIESLDDPNPLIRYRAAKVLARIGPDAVEAVPALIKHLSDIDESVRREAARAIGQIGPDASEAVPHLIKALKSDDAS